VPIRNDASGASARRPKSLSATLAQGRFLDGGTERYPAVVLGAVAAQRLGIVSLESQPRVYVGGRYLNVVGILAPVTLASAIDRSWSRSPTPRPPSTPKRTRRTPTSASTTLGSARSGASSPATANPEHPEEVDVSRASDALEAKAAAQGGFTSLFLGLGAVALLVGRVGIANVMVISVLERRSEIGLRRALGATRRHISIQFLTESLLLATLGGSAGAALARS
jgi:putative ABC transport system permease protein